MKKKIGYVSYSNPFLDKKDWSGTRYKLREALENAGYNVEWIPYSVPKIKVIFVIIILKLLYGINFDYRRHPLYYLICARTINYSKIKKCDALFFPGCAQLMPYVKYDKPVIYCIDATYNLIACYYSKCSQFSIKYGNLTEKNAINKSTIVIHSSEWSRKSAISFYHSCSEKHFVLEFGANIDDSDIGNCASYDGKVLNVLFSGVDWYRKGAQQAIEIVGELCSRGIESKLFLCGIKEIPQENLPLPYYVQHVGFLDKNIKEQYEKYVSIIRQCNILLLPTIADCSPIVFCESSAFGMPIFTYSIGGIENYVKDGVNGYRLPPFGTVKDFADKIQNCIYNKELEKLSMGGKKMYYECLNWNVWSRGFNKIIKEHLNI